MESPIESNQSFEEGEMMYGSQNDFPKEEQPKATFIYHVACWVMCLLVALACCSSLSSTLLNWHITGNQVSWSAGARLICRTSTLCQPTNAGLVRDSLWSTLRSSRPTDATLAIRSPPTHLVVLIHGLQGSSADLDFLRRELMQMSPSVLVLSARRIEGQTRSGVASGGALLAQEIQQCVSEHRSLVSISLVGNSLGGLYARYAAAVLFDAQKGTIAGLKPQTFLSIAAPHLGVRRFTFVPLPRLAHPLADLVVGQSGTDLFLRDGPRPLLLRMATDEPFRGALRAFRSRIAFANRGGDFMVPYGSAAIDVTAHWLPGVADPFVEWVGNTGGAATQLPTGVMMLETYIPAASSAPPVLEGEPEELTMARSLNALGWRKVGVTFPGARVLPLAHNKLAALERQGWRYFAFGWLEQNREGEPVMQRAAALLLEAPPT